MAQSQAQSHMLLQRLTSPFFVACWLLASACTMGAFWQYELTPGSEHPIRQTWPAAAKTGVVHSQKSLLMFVHPQCGCTKAGLRELQELLGTIPEGKYPAVTFILLQPGRPPGSVLDLPASALPATTTVNSVFPGTSAGGQENSREATPGGQIAGSTDSQIGTGWVESTVAAICRDIPGSQILWDAGGVEARCFGVTTSGTCLLYSSSGTLLYAGGLTVSRGHAGPNRGRDLLTQSLLQSDDSPAGFQSQDGSCQHYPTFGCALFSERDRSAL